jgi:hypothetical protein
LTPLTIFLKSIDKDEKMNLDKYLVVEKMNLDKYLVVVGHVESLPNIFNGILAPFHDASKTVNFATGAFQIT